MTKFFSGPEEAFPQNYSWLLNKCLQAENLPSKSCLKPLPSFLLPLLHSFHSGEQAGNAGVAVAMRPSMQLWAHNNAPDAQCLHGGANSVASFVEFLLGKIKDWRVIRVSCDKPFVVKYPTMRLYIRGRGHSTHMTSAVWVGVGEMGPQKADKTTEDAWIL